MELLQMNDEVWKDFKDYEGLYQVSNYGRVKNYKDYILSPHFSHKFYHRITIVKETKKKNFSIHRLVAQAFIPNSDNKTEVNHKDFNKLNNHVDNLEWTSGEENRLHYFESDRYKLWLQTVVK
jgi:hypothetical protein